MMLCAPGRPIVRWTECNAQVARVRKKVPGRKIINATIIVVNNHLRSCTTVLPRTRIGTQSRKFSHVVRGGPALVSLASMPSPSHHAQSPTSGSSTAARS
jgi:hypothetical protein